jgi:DNA polymerase
VTLITADFESHYSQTFSLSRLTTEAYIRSPEFETIGISIKIDNGPTRWYPKPEVKAALAEIDWDKAFLLCQNSAFDAAILAWHYGIQPKGLFDTLGMSRALFPHEKSHSLASQAKRADIGVKGDEVVHAMGKRYADFTPEALARYGAYCCNDVDLTYTLFQRYMEMQFPAQELKLIDLTLRMFTRPLLRLDADLLIDHLRDVKERKADLMATVSSVLDATDDVELKKQLMSNPKFAQLLTEHGVLPPMKLSLTTGKETYAFAKSDEEFLQLQEHPNLTVQALVAARLGVKSTLEETRTERFIEMSGRGAFPVPLRYYGAHSGRWSGQDQVNLQNLPSRDPKGRALKNAILAPEGYVIIDSDSSQIEARVLAWLAGQDDLVQAFRNKEDVYRLMASRIYGKPPGEITKAERQVGKTVILGCGFGTGAKKLQAYLKATAGVDVEEAEAKRIVETYRQANYKIVELWKKADTALTYLRAGMTWRIDMHGLCIVAPGKGITLPNKLHIQYPGLRQVATESGKTEWVYDSKGEVIRIFGPKVVENFTQAIARCVIAEQLIRISRKYDVVLTVHDAVACVAPEAEATKAQAFVEECMRWVPAWAKGLPLDCESGVGASYGAC